MNIIDFLLIIYSESKDSFQCYIWIKELVYRDKSILKVPASAGNKPSQNNIRLISWPDNPWIYIQADLRTWVSKLKDCKRFFLVRLSQGQPAALKSDGWVIQSSVFLISFYIYKFSQARLMLGHLINLLNSLIFFLAVNDNYLASYTRKS